LAKSLIKEFSHSILLRNMNDSSPYPVVTGNTLILLQYLPFSKCETSGIRRFVFIWGIGAIPQHLDQVRLEVLTSLSQLPQTLTEALHSCETYDQLMYWTETMRTEYPGLSIAITHSSHMPPSKPQTLLMSLSSRLVAGGFLTMAYFSNLFLEMLHSLTELSITKIVLEIWQRCMEARSSLVTLIDRRSERAARSKKAQAIAWGRLRGEVKWIMQNADEPPSDGDKGLSSEKSGQKIPQSGS